MRDLGELTLYIEKLDFKSKNDLKNQLENLLKNADDFFTKNSLQTALEMLKSVNEEELKQIKGSF